LDTPTARKIRRLGFMAGQIAVPDGLPAPARGLLDDPQNEPIFSSASLWGLAI